MITITEEITIPSPPERVWAVVSNPSDVVSCIKGAELGDAHDDGSFDGALAVKFGAVRVRFAARVTLELAESELSGRISARGRDGQGATRFTSGAQFEVRPEGAAASRVTVRGEVGITGKLARLVESGANAMVGRMTKDFAAALIDRCAEADRAAVPGVAGTTVALGSADTATSVAPTRVSGPAAPARPRLLARWRAWFARLLHRPPAPDIPSAPRTPSATEEVGNGNAKAQ